MTLLSYSEKYVVQSTSSVTSSSSTLANDTQASQTFSLPESRTVLVIYAANSAHGNTNAENGFKNAINIDGTDRSQLQDSGYTTNYSVRNTCFWVGSLSAGEHTITGRLASNVNATNTTVSNRTLIIYIFTGDEFTFIDNSTAQSLASQSYIDDSYAQATFTPSAPCTALILYAVTNPQGVTEWSSGKKICIKVATTDYTACEARKSSNNTDYADSVTTAYALALDTVSTTVKGRVAGNAAQTVTVSRRQLAVLLLDQSVTLDVDSDTIQVSSSSTTMTDDAYASIARSTSGELLAIAQATKRYGNTATTYGLTYGINIDSTDVAKSRSSPCYPTEAEGSLVAYATSVSAGDHTVKGRFATNYSTTAADVDTRILIALWFQVAPISRNFAAISDIHTLEEFSASNDTLFSTSFTENNDVHVLEDFTASNDTFLSTRFTTANDLALKLAFSGSNDLRCSKNFAASNDLRYTFSFPALSDIRVSNAYSTTSDIRLGEKTFSSINDLLLNYAVSAASDIGMSAEFASNNIIIAVSSIVVSSSNDLLVSKAFSAGSDVRVVKPFAAYSNTYIRSTAVSTSDVVLSKTYGSDAGIKTSASYASASDVLIYTLYSSQAGLIVCRTFSNTSSVKLIKVFESSTVIVYVDLFFAHPLTVTVSKVTRQITIAKFIRESVPNATKRTATISTTSRTATISKNDRSVALH